MTDDAQPHRPKLLVFEDRPLFGDIAQRNYSRLGYDVELVPLLDPHRAEYIAGGELDHAKINAHIALMTRETCKAQLTELEGYRYAAASTDDMRAVMDKVQPDAVLCDHKLHLLQLNGHGYSDGFEVVDAVRAWRADMPIVMHAPYGKPDYNATIVAKAQHANLAMFDERLCQQIDASLRQQMHSIKPGTTVSAVEKAKPKLVIFDDDLELLERFTRQYVPMGYDVTPVLVDNGLVCYPFDGHRVENKDQVRALLAQVKPDCVLSDMQMRSFADYHDMTPEQRMADPDTIMGDHIMAMAAELEPKPLRAIHSGQFTLQDNDRDVIREKKGQMLAEARRESHPHGYSVHAKDRDGEGWTALTIHRHFEQQLKGRERT